MFYCKAYFENIFYFDYGFTDQIEIKEMYAYAYCITY